jgi:DNA/RNA endonuclease YhcR with UshA esterase domain
MKMMLSLFPLLLSCILMQDNKIVSSNPSPIIPISQARGMPLGSEVTIQGTITVASGTFSSSIPFGYALQDNTAGIYVVDSILIRKDEFILGEQVKVSGIIDEINNLLVIREAVASKNGKGKIIKPINLGTGSVNESYEGMIIHTSGIIDSLANDQPYGYKIYINDGSGPLTVFVNTSTGLLSDTTQWKVCDSLSVIGFSAQYGTAYENEPRMAKDIKVFPKN